jgi:hypothetical protein
MDLGFVVMSEKKYRYHTVNLSENLTAIILELIASGKHGYTNIPDFSKEARAQLLPDADPPIVDRYSVSLKMATRSSHFIRPFSNLEF